jgi:hypothetical protein
MNWYRLDLMHGTDPVLVEDSWTLFWEVSRASVGADVGSAIFAVNGREGLTLYFSPTARNLAEAVGAVACAKPSADRLTLIVGGLIHFGVVVPKSR